MLSAKLCSANCVPDSRGLNGTRQDRGSDDSPTRHRRCFPSEDRLRNFVRMKRPLSSSLFALRRVAQRHGACPGTFPDCGVSQFRLIIRCCRIQRHSHKTLHDLSPESLTATLEIQGFSVSGRGSIRGAVVRKGQREAESVPPRIVRQREGDAPAEPVS